MIRILLYSFLLAGSVQDSTGIEGMVYMTTVNQMPSPDLKPAPHTGIRSTIYIFELTRSDQVVPVEGSPYYSTVKTRLLQQVNTDDKGYFNVLLPPGRYSVFTKKGILFYAGRRDDKNNIAPVEVSPGKMTRFDCRVESDHKTVY